MNKREQIRAEKAELIKKNWPFPVGAKPEYTGPAKRMPRFVSFPYLLTETDVDEIFEAAGIEIWKSLWHTSRPDMIFAGWAIWHVDGKPGPETIS